jgi:hypothetical protein
MRWTPEVWAALMDGNRDEKENPGNEMNRPVSLKPSAEELGFFPSSVQKAFFRRTFVLFSLYRQAGTNLIFLKY